MASPTSARASAAGVEEAGVGRAGAVLDGRRSRSAGKARSGARVKSPVIGGFEVDDGGGDAAAHGRHRLGAGGDDEVAAQDQAGTAGGDARCADLVLGGGELQVGEDGTALLGHADHVQRRDALALEVRGHAEQGGDGDHAGAADAGDEDAVGAVEGRAARARAGPGTARRRAPWPCAAGRP